MVLENIQFVRSITEGFTARSARLLSILKCFSSKWRSSFGDCLRLNATVLPMADLGSSCSADLSSQSLNCLGSGVISKLFLLIKMHFKF